MNGSLKSVEEIAEMIGTEAKDGKIETVVEGVKVKMERANLNWSSKTGIRCGLKKSDPVLGFFCLGIFVLVMPPLLGLCMPRNVKKFWEFKRD